MCDYIIGAPLVLSFVIIILATPPHQPVINRSGFEWGQVRPVPFVLLVPKACVDIPLVVLLPDREHSHTRDGTLLVPFPRVLCAALEASVLSLQTRVQVQATCLSVDPTK